jgi:hypothetical protein
MNVQFEQQVNIKFCMMLDKTATETLQLLHNAYCDEALSRSRSSSGKGNSCQGGYQWRMAQDEAGLEFPE